MLEEIKALLDQESRAISQIPATDSFLKAIDLIYNRVHLMKGKLICSGMGKAGQIAINIATTFSSTGTPAVFLHPSDAQHGDLGVIQEDDVLLLVSNSGETREIIELIGLTANLFPGIPLIVTKKDIVRRRLKRLVWVTGTVGTLAVGVTVFHFMVMDLFVIWAIVMRKLAL